MATQDDVRRLARRTERDGAFAARAGGSVRNRLSAGETAMLDDAGFVEGRADVPSAIERSRLELGVLVRNSLSIDEAARALRVTTSRLQQRLSSKRPTLYGIKEGRDWRIPRFQFASRSRLVRGIDRVIPHVRRDAHPVAVGEWFTTPHQDLVMGDDDDCVTPRAWLSSGRSPAVVAELAHEI